MAVGDLVAMPLKQNPGQVAIGEWQDRISIGRSGVNTRHTRAVDWHDATISRDRFRDDIVVA